MTRTVEFSDLIGVPYRLGGTDPEVGLDCLGLMIVIYKRLGWTLAFPEFDFRKDWRHLCDAYLAFYGAKHWQPIARARLVGDVILFRGAEQNQQHVATVVSPGQLIHTTAHLGVHVMPLRDFRRIPIGSYRYAHS